jgi:hypothetical protein
VAWPERDGVWYAALDTNERVQVYEADFTDRYAIQLAGGDRSVAFIGCTTNEYASRGEALGQFCPGNDWAVRWINLGPIRAPGGG